MDMVAHVTMGKEWPDYQPCPVGSCLVANVEDMDDSIIVPRLAAAGANLDYVWIMELDDPNEEVLQIPNNVPKLSKHLEYAKSLGPPVKLITVDPLDAFAGDQTDLNRSQHARKALRSLELLASEHNCAVVVVRHLSKSKGRTANYRGLGSISLIGASRSAMAVGRDPSDTGRSILASVKGNWAVAPASLAFRTIPATYRTTEGSAIVTSKLAWEGEIKLTAEDLVDDSDVAFRPGELEDARQLLETELADGNMVPHKALVAIGKGQAVSQDAIWRAGRLLGVRKESRGGEWVWFLDKELTKGADFS